MSSRFVTLDASYRGSGSDPAVQIAMKTTIEAGIYAPNGSLVAEMELDYSGSIIARRVEMDRSASERE